MSSELFVSIDLDGLHHHLRGYGAAGESARPLSDAVLSRALPRFLDLFARLDVRATFFVIGEDAAGGAAHLRGIVEAGHEIASHGFTHPLPFTSVPAESIRDEVERSKSVLEQVCGAPVRGFRAPGFGISPQILRTIAAAGYTYDSSVLPSPLQALQVIRLDVARRSPRWQGVRQALRYMLAPREPHRLPQGLWELPVLVTPILRLPVYHTPRLLFGAGFFRRLARSISSDAYAHYVFHGIDLLDAAEIDSALLHHPGCRLPLAQKMAIAEECLRLLSAGRTPRRLDEFAALATVQGSRTTTPMGRGAAARSILTLETSDRDSGDKT